MRPRKLHLIALAFVCLTGAVVSTPALGVVVGSTDVTAFSNPNSPYYGMTMDYVYKHNPQNNPEGSIVAIGYFSFITARHFGAGVGNIFTIDGDQFQVTAVQYAPPDSGKTYAPDLEILTVRNNTHPNRPLPDFYQVLQSVPAVFPQHQLAVIVGAGRSGSLVPNGQGGLKPVEDMSSPEIIRWGTNQYDGQITSADIFTTNAPINASTKVFRMQFDSSLTTTDCYYGHGDSGGGVFFKDATTGKWELGGINLYRGWGTGNLYDSSAASLYSYKDWINGVLAQPIERLPGDANHDEAVDSLDYIVLKENFGQTGRSWEQGDFNGDGTVNRADLSIFELNYGYVSPRHAYSSEDGSPGSVVPEPACLALLAAGAVSLLLRRSRRGSGSR